MMLSACRLARNGVAARSAVLRANPAIALFPPPRAGLVRRPPTVRWYDPRRAERPGPGGWSTYLYVRLRGKMPTFPVWQTAIVWSFIGVNIVVFVNWAGAKAEAQAKGDPRRLQWMMDNFTFSRRNLDEGRWWTLVTCAVSHEALLHMVINMTCFTTAMRYLFYVNVGLPRIVLLSVGSAIAASAGHLLDWQTNPKGLPDVGGLGTSGVVEGQFMALALRAGLLPVRLIFPPITLSIRTVTALVVAWDLYSLREQRKKDGVDILLEGGSLTGHAAHLGGAAFGALFYFLALRGPMRMGFG